ncbi:MAG: ATP-binding protein, partial [Ferruginibacter sp.]
MKIKKLIYYITAVFIVGTMIIIGMQYITSKNVNELITGNQNLLEEFQLTNKLTNLQKDMLVADNTLKNALISENPATLRDFEGELMKIETDIAGLKTEGSTTSIRNDIAELNDLVHHKLQFSNDVVNTFSHSGKQAAEILFATGKGTGLSQDIFLLAQKIDTNRQLVLSQTTTAIDNSGTLALRWGVIMIGVVLILFTIIFWFIITRMKKQYDLIHQLNDSEKRIKEVIQVKDNFLANMSHEIRTPMNAILGYTNLLLRNALDKDSKLHLSIIQSSGENLLSIINDILDISKIEAGMMRIEEAPFGIRGLIHSIESMFKNKVKEKGLLLTVNIEKTLEDVVLGDATRLTQVLVNLVGNAIKFTEIGTVILDVSQQFVNDSTVDVIFRITDTGIGIEKSKLPSIFDRFIQAEETTTRKFGGTGLGLSIVKSIIEIQEGQINIESEPGAGTSVVFKIPYKRSSAFFPYIPNTNKPAPAPLKAGLRILLVEDNVINQGLVSHLLKDWKIDHLIAGNGKEAISILMEKQFDLILMDIQMPEMDGYE